jgi:hypothetical protein
MKSSRKSTHHKTIRNSKMIISRANIIQCFKVGQLIFRPVDVNGGLDTVDVTSVNNDHPLNRFVQTTISSANQCIYEPTVSTTPKGIITWLSDESGKPFCGTDMPENWWALRIRRECKSQVLNATILEADKEALEYYLRWREEVSKLFDNLDAVKGLPLELAPNANRLWFKPQYDEPMVRVIAYDVNPINF